MSPKSSLTIYVIGVLGALLICTITALIGFQLGINEGVAVNTGINAGENSRNALTVPGQASTSTADIAEAQPAVSQPATNLQQRLSKEKRTLTNKEQSTQAKNLSIMAAENRKLAAEIQRLVDQLGTERNTRTELEFLVDGLKHQLNIDKTAYADLKVSLKESSNNMTNLRDELNFYRNILSPDENGTGIQVDLFSINALDEPGRYQYEFTLIQMQPHDRPMVGSLDVEIEGVSEGIRKIVDVTIFGDSLEKKLNFTYYRRVQGEFNLPAGFSPSGMSISFSADSDSTVAVSQTYPWPEAVGDAVAN